MRHTLHTLVARSTILNVTTLNVCSLFIYVYLYVVQYRVHLTSFSFQHWCWHTTTAAKQTTNQSIVFNKFVLIH